MIKILLIASLFLLPLYSCDDMGSGTAKEEMNKNTVMNDLLIFINIEGKLKTDNG